MRFVGSTAVRAGHHDLVLVNRVLDADGPAAQEVAVALEATRRFGKNTLTGSETRELLT